MGRVQLNITRWENAATKLNFEVRPVEIRLQCDIDRVIAELPQQNIDAVAVVAGTLFFAAAARGPGGRMTEIAERLRVFGMVRREIRVFRGGRSLVHACARVYSVSCDRSPTAMT